MMRNGRRFVLLLGLALMLSACSEMRALMGLERKTPDEFAVVARAPLTLPPSFDLPPPSPGAPRPQEGSSDAQAQAALFGNRAQGFYFEGQFVPAGAGSPAESLLLTQAGAGDAPPDIRSVVNREAALEAVDEAGFVEGLMFWRDRPPPGVVVDAPAEARRLANNSALGLPLNEGEVPVIEPEELAPLEGLVN